MKMFFIRRKGNGIKQGKKHKHYDKYGFHGNPVRNVFGHLGLSIGKVLDVGGSKNECRTENTDLQIVRKNEIPAGIQ